MGEGWIRGILTWVAFGVLFTIAAKPPVSAIAISLMAGVLAGWAELVLAIRTRKRWMRPAVLLIGLGLMTLLIVAIHGSLDVVAWIGLGALQIATSTVASAIIGTRICQRLNRQYEQTARMLRQRYPETRPQAPEPVPAESRDQFLACLPHDLRGEAERFFGISLIAVPFRSMDYLAPTHSCLSGPAFLPPGHPWPHRQGQPMEFLCQIRLQDLPATSHKRPATGLLSFFVDPEDTPWGHDERDGDGFRVLYHADETRLVATVRPGTGKHPPLRKPLRFMEVPEFIPTSDFEDRFRDFVDQADEELGERADEWFETMREGNAADSHRVLSRPVLAQSDMDADLQFAARHFGMPEETTWTMLLQLDSDRDLGWCWGDAGYLYFWVPADDLAVARFDRCWLVLQCG